MKKSSLTIFCAFCLVGMLHAQTNKALPIVSKTPFQIGESITLHSAQLKEDRSLNIYLPPSYTTDAKRSFPVIYLLDGSADEDFIHTVGLVQYGNFPWINMLPESIVVGIANVDRRRDFTFPTTIEKDKKDYPTTGSSASFIQFLEQELQPFIQQDYRTNDTTTLIGQSLGGLLATEILFKKPDMFMNYIIISPSLWWDHESLLKVKPAVSSKNKTVYVSVGGDEEKEMISGASKLMEVLSGTAYRHFFKLAQGYGHGDIMHLALYDAFVQVFATKASKD